MEVYDGQIHDGHNINDSHNHDGTKSKPKQNSTVNEVIEVSNKTVTSYINNRQQLMAVEQSKELCNGHS